LSLKGTIKVVADHDGGEEGLCNSVYKPRWVRGVTRRSSRHRSGGIYSLVSLKSINILFNALSSNEGRLSSSTRFQMILGVLVLESVLVVVGG